ncbi:hypothetical protein [Streptomyces sp. PBH53]|uniref:hypothetical protein n=1 Tax=Streptomyces sp. PBH53 TaxID=1577075 RepID=UPI000A44C4E8|nr:hypothetical protein [Streptomyces sp. PBH53]
MAGEGRSARACRAHLRRHGTTAALSEGAADPLAGRRRRHARPRAPGRAVHRRRDAVDRLGQGRGSATRHERQPGRHLAALAPAGTPARRGT